MEREQGKSVMCLGKPSDVLAVSSYHVSFPFREGRGQRKYMIQIIQSLDPSPITHHMAKARYNLSMKFPNTISASSTNCHP